MEVVTKEEFLLKLDHFIERINNGEVFIHPTDTIYGIGCSALHPEAVNKIRNLKQTVKPFSVIAPSFDWIFDSCDVTHKGWVNKLPDAYTFILKQAKVNAVSEEVNKNSGSLGIRMPKHWFSGVVEMCKTPVVSTSVNVSGTPFMKTLDDLDDDFKNSIDFVIYEGEKNDIPSTIVDLTGPEPDIKTREKQVEVLFK